MLKKIKNWLCYLLYSLETNETYIGATNDFKKRIRTHNRGKGAKRTKGRIWLPILLVTGFHDKRAALSFEKGWQKLYKRRNLDRFTTLNLMTGKKYRYNKNNIWNRVMDLLYFTHNVTLLGTKFMLNYKLDKPIYLPELKIKIYLEKFKLDFPPEITCVWI